MSKRITAWPQWRKVSCYRILPLMDIQHHSDPVSGVAQQLVQAWQHGTAADAAALSCTLETDVQAYAVQHAVAEALGWLQPRPTVWKAGAAGRNSQPTAAMLPHAGVHRDPAHLDGQSFHMCGIEAEIAFRLRQHVGESSASKAFELEQYVDAMCVSIEIVDSRWLQGMLAPPLLKLADMQSHGALILSEWVPIRAVDWQKQHCLVSINDEIRAQTVGAHPCGDPTWIIDWWIRHAIGRVSALEAGDVVTTGTWAGIVPAQPGETIEALFPGIGQARVHLSKD